MHAGRGQCDPNPGRLQRGRDGRNRARDQENVAEKCERRRRREAGHQHEDLHQRRLGLLREETNPALQESGQRAGQRKETTEQAGVSRGIAEPHRVASHSAQSLAAENQPENKSDPERGEDRLGRILSHVLLAILLHG
jgi:hypothetical protein